MRDQGLLFEVDMKEVELAVEDGKTHLLTSLLSLALVC